MIARSSVVYNSIMEQCISSKSLLLSIHLVISSAIEFELCRQLMFCVWIGTVVSAITVLNRLSLMWGLYLTKIAKSDLMLVY